MTEPSNPLDKAKADAIETLLSRHLDEQRRSRRWGIFFKLSILIYFVALLIMAVPSDPASRQIIKKPHTALIDIRGMIAPTKEASADNIVTNLRRAFSNKSAQAVILRINSPGGSPVQSDYVYNEIKRLRALHPNVKVYAVCTDTCASGAYYIAAAADKIYANSSSLVGSIGVLLNGFGFVDTIEKLGIQRRLITAGVNKGFLDPFSPLPEAQKQHAQDLVNSIQATFIQRVREGRGERLRESDEIFSGLVWTGDQSLSLGLIDGIASTGEVARDIVKNENIIRYAKPRNVLEGLAKKFGTSFAHTIGAYLGLAQPGAQLLSSQLDAGRHN